VNSTAIYALHKNVDSAKQKTFEHRFELVTQLVKPHIARRNQTYFPMVVNQKIGIIIGDNSQNDQPNTDDGPAFGERRRRCIQKAAA
jgi:hemerythrin-like domain-containing protein